MSTPNNHDYQSATQLVSLNNLIKRLT